MTMTPDPSWSPKQVIENWYATVWNEGRRDAIRALFRGRAEGLAAAPAPQGLTRQRDVVPVIRSVKEDASIQKTARQEVEDLK